LEQNSELLAAHHARWAAFDPLLADSRALPGPEAADEVLTCPGGMALVRNVQTDPDSWGHTFFATHESKLVPRVDDPRAFAELLDLWAAQDTFRPGPDSIVSVNWPSRCRATPRWREHWSSGDSSRRPCSPCGSPGSGCPREPTPVW
jgi:hypothetical protein